MNETKEPAYLREPSSAEEAIEALIAERDGLKKRAEKAEERLSSMAEYSIELQRLIEALSGRHPVPDAARAPMHRALAKGVKDELAALRKRVVELEDASMAADREIRGALVWADQRGNPAIVVSQLKCSVSGATEAIAERDALKAKLVKTEHERDVARGMAIEAIAFSESATRLEERAEKAEHELAELRCEVEAVLSAGQSVRIREGGGPENLAASLAVTVSKLRSDAWQPAPKCRHGYPPSLCLADASCDGPTN